MIRNPPMVSSLANGVKPDAGAIDYLAGDFSTTAA
jgi:hypothetical protein